MNVRRSRIEVHRVDLCKGGPGLQRRRCSRPPSPQPSVGRDCDSVQGSRIECLRLHCRRPSEQAASRARRRDMSISVETHLDQTRRNPGKYFLPPFFPYSFFFVYCSRSSRNNRTILFLLRRNLKRFGHDRISYRNMKTDELVIKFLTKRI